MEIVEKIKKLLKHSESAKSIGSIEEAELFSKKAHKLLIEHNLSLASINTEEDRFSNWKLEPNVSYKNYTAGSKWRLRLLQIIANYHLCNFVYNSRTISADVYGSKENVDVVIYLFNYLSTVFDSAAKQKFKGMSYSFKTTCNKYHYFRDFLIGATDGLLLKFEEQNRQSEYSSQITDFMVNNKEALKEFRDSVIGKVKNVAHRGIIIRDKSYYEGLEVGKSANLNSGLNAAEEIVKSKLIK